MKRFGWFTVLQALCLTALAIGPNETVQKYIDSVQNKYGFPGVCVSFLTGDGEIHSLSAGWSNNEANKRMNPNAVMLSGSAPKMFYSTIALQLTEHSRLDLDAKVKDYLSKKSWYSRIPNSGDITIRQLLNHSSGIMEYYPLGDFIDRVRGNPDETWTPVELLSYVFDQEPLFTAGGDFSYADTNYILLGVVVEEITGQSIFDLVESAVLDKLKMEATHPALSRNIPGLVNGYQQPNSPFGFGPTSLKDGQLVFNPQFEWCGGGYVSTTEDWVQFITGLMKGNLLKEQARSEMMSGIDCNLGPGQKYGLGLQIRPSTLGVGYGHGGWFPGYLTEVEYFPDEDIAVAIQFNTDDFSKIGAHPRSHLLAIARLVKSHSR